MIDWDPTDLLFHSPGDCALCSKLYGVPVRHAFLDLCPSQTDSNDRPNDEGAPDDH